MKLCPKMSWQIWWDVRLAELTEIKNILENWTVSNNWEFKFKSAFISYWNKSTFKFKTFLFWLL
ncbi:hypothetical protein [Spiroplasma citri]|nr:hypothetical protein [Spiroplasma citri]APE74855.1 hypothetical protein SCITRI_00970 [Spiroplasma citri]QED24776.1 hypothetical protein FRX96_04960 [Spiroplasma citri]QIA67127.1 hypothetical protein GMI18_05400 [Spiroplasma citri]QIA69034.1 hypothetical protein GL298_05640 [Spiroplasma citri]QIA70901.1 hypothetical protein GL981_05700 [Spiroplasma citri]